jgi:heme/copper-type cytochrome/quinol oxidase subunit 3
MDTVGDAQEFAYDDESALYRPPRVTTEALALTSLVTAVCSLFLTFASAVCVLLLANALGVNGSDNETRQYTLVMTPVAMLSATAVALGVTALKRRSDDRWVAALAIAGVVVGAVILVLAAAGFLVTMTSNPSPTLGQQH